MVFPLVFGKPPRLTLGARGGFLYELAVASETNPRRACLAQQTRKGLERKTHRL